MNLSEKISLILVDKGFSLSPKKNTEDLINSGAELHKNNEDIKIAEQHGIADQIFILLKGEAEFVKYHNNVFYNLATLKNSGSPLGISGLNAPGRYMSDIFIKGNSEYISFKIEKLKELEEIDPDYASFFYSYLLFLINQKIHFCFYHTNSQVNFVFLPNFFLLNHHCLNTKYLKN